MIGRWIRPSLPLLVAAFTLLVSATTSQACRRRLLSILPAEGARNAFERDLVGIVTELEGCFEGFRVAFDERSSVVAVAAGRWRTLHTQWEKLNPGPEIPTPDFRQIMGSIDAYIRRIEAAVAAGEHREAYRQEVGLQHVVAELYEINPGTVSRLEMARYSVGSLEFLSHPDPSNAQDWANRLELVERRVARWFDTSFAEARKLPQAQDLNTLPGVMREAVLRLQDREDAVARASFATSYAALKNASAPLATLVMKAGWRRDRLARKAKAPPRKPRTSRRQRRSRRSTR